MSKTCSRPLIWLRAFLPIQGSKLNRNESEVSHAYAKKNCLRARRGLLVVACGTSGGDAAPDNFRQGDVDDAGGGDARSPLQAALARCAGGTSSPRRSGS